VSKVQVLQVKAGDRLVCSRCLSSPSVFFRMKGLLGRAHLPEGEGILLSSCNSIHMFFMKFAIDAVFLDKESRVVYLCERIAPWKISRVILSAKSVLEIPAGTVAKHGIRLGDVVVFEAVKGL
jgi:uncharacterized membrane protein (UPF0127 family)